ncbi:hypothetical protein SLH46_20105 [Draconibacterium sp. IB214405]|uniref:hypothetical protein n=1 Tax=Draconibacterium sp. IB214405 TaxID=3097352 RepID=UPI002A0C0084|nr:hypothetical protein [Draconibacterium sp. IB214405]MDX8341513.1 hypothetical protein [Draconibacterium sp. IB214405]
MKTRLHFKFLVTIAAFLIGSQLGWAQNYEASKTLNKSASVKADVRINLSNHAGDIKINTTNDNTVTISTEIKVDASNREDAEKLIAAIEAFEFDQRGNTLDIDTRFYKNMNSTNGRSTITLLNGDKVKIKDFEIRHEMNIPKSANLNLENKYSSVSLGESSGENKLNLYSSELHAEGFLSVVGLEAKYSKLHVEKFNDKANFILYDTDIEFKTAGDINIESKYSKIEGSTAANLEIESYDDKVLIDGFSNLKMDAKYTDLVSEAELEKLSLNLYDCNLKISSAKSAEFSGKYSELKLGKVKTLTIPESYDNDIYLDKTVSIDITESKYSKYIIKSTSKLSIVGYDDDIDIDELNTDFEGISFDAKYGKLIINAGSVPFKIDAQMKYGKVDFPKTLLPSRHVEKSGELELLAGDKGNTILIRGYDNTVNIE